jgi:hypothetical protein
VDRSGISESVDSPDLRRRPPDFDATVATDADPLVAIQNAALERALLAETDSSEYVLLAGALERARREDASERVMGDDTSSVLSDESAVDADRIAGSLLTATLTATLAVRHGLGGGEPPRPASPTVADSPADTDDGDRRERLLLEGALLAVERFGATTAEAAALAEVGVPAFERQLARRS